jgi:hypothetical protein
MSQIVVDTDVASCSNFDAVDRGGGPVRNRSLTFTGRHDALLRSRVGQGDGRGRTHFARIGPKKAGGPTNAVGAPARPTGLSGGFAEGFG